MNVYKWHRRMEKPLRILFLAIFFAGLSLNTVSTPLIVKAASFTPGNLVVYRVGDGTGTVTANGNANPVFLDEYNPSTTNQTSPVQSIAMPTAVNGSNKRLTAAGSATSEGMLTLSADGNYIIVPGYDADTGTLNLPSTSPSSTNRVIGRVDSAGNVDTTTALNDATGNPRSAASTNGSNLWLSSNNNGVRYTTIGSASSSTQILTTPANVRNLNVFDGQLYMTSGSSPYIGISKVGTGTPTTSGQTATLMIDTSGVGSSPSPYGFMLFDLDNGIAGFDRAYIADDRSVANGGGIQRWDYNGTAWTYNYTLGIGSGGRGLTGVNNSGTVTLYATTAGNTLVSISDTSSSATATTLTTGTAGKVIRGVAFVPGGPVAPTAPTIPAGTPADQIIYANNSTTLTVSPSGTAPITYQWYQGLSGDTSTPVGTNSASYTTPNLTVNTTYWVRVTNSVGFADSRTVTITIDNSPPCATLYTHPHSIQGTTDVSPPPWNGASNVTTQGVVVADYEGASPALRGFYIQDNDPDNDPLTSEGLFVFTNGSDNNVTVGQLVRITGTVTEFQGQTQITPNSGGIIQCGETGSITPTNVSLPFATADYPERFEGMLVTLPQTLYVSETFQLGRFGQILMSSGDRLRQPTQIAEPGTAANAVQTANDLNQIVIDDSTQTENPDPIIFGRGTSPLSATNTLREGDTATGITGIMTYTWGGNAASPNAYRVRPTIQPTFVDGNPRPTDPESVGGTLRVAGLNLLNYFNTFSSCTAGEGGAASDCRGADNSVEFERQAAKTLASITNVNADVIAFSEIENDGYGSSSAIQNLIDRLNAATAPGTYAFINPDTDNGTNSLGTDTIKVGIFYKPGKVTPVGTTAVLNTGAFGLYTLTSGSPVGRNRPALAQSFKQNSNNEQFTLVANHLKSKGSDCLSNVSPVPTDPDTGDGQGNCNLTRTAAAEEEVDWLATNPTGISDPDILVMGDMNSYAKEDPIAAFEAGGYENLIASKIGEDAYSYVFDGQSGYLDHALGSASLSSQVTGVTEYHNNADEPATLDYNTNFKSAGQVTSLYAADQYRASDHDPVIVGLNLACDPLVVTSATDDGTTGTCGKLSEAIRAANTLNATGGASITFTVNTILLTASLPKIDAVNAANPITIGPSCEVANASVTNRVQIKPDTGVNIATILELGKGVKVQGLAVTGYTTVGVKVTGTANTMNCTWVGTADGTTTSTNGSAKGIEVKQAIGQQAQLKLEKGNKIRAGS